MTPSLHHQGFGLRHRLIGGRRFRRGFYLSHGDPLFGFEICPGGFSMGYTLSFEHGVQKPDLRLFQIALDQLGVTPRESLMVGDRAARDSGAASLGITTLILPPVPNHTPRGLDIVLRLLSSA